MWQANAGEPFDDVESELDRLRRVSKNRAHLPRTRPGSRSILLSSSRMYCEVTLLYLLCSGT